MRDCVKSGHKISQTRDSQDLYHCPGQDIANRDLDISKK